MNDEFPFPREVFERFVQENDGGWPCVPLLRPGHPACCYVPNLTNVAVHMLISDDWSDKVLLTPQATFQ